MNKQPAAADEQACRDVAAKDDLLCICMKISRASVIARIESGASDLDQLMRCCRAGSGCGTCRVDLIHLLREHGR